MRSAVCRDIPFPGTHKKSARRVIPSRALMLSGRLSSGYRPVKFAWPAALGTVRGAGFGFGIGLDLSAELASFGTGHFTSGFHGK